MDTKKLRQKILDLAIHGKLVPQDPNDEPASVLLERIRAEKERLVKEGKIKKSKKTAKTSDTPHYEQVPFDLPKGWAWTTVEEVCSKIGSGSTPKGSNYSEMGIPFFRSQNVYNEGLVYDDIKFISEEVHEHMIGTEVLANDVLLNITGGSLGRCAVVPKSFVRGNVSQHVCILRPVIIEPQYLHAFILSSFFAKTMKITGSGREGLPKYNLERMALPIPPIREQERIIEEMNRWLRIVDGIKFNKNNLSATINETKSKLLDLAIHGKLVPQDPEDEPAIELLRRINPGFTPCLAADSACDNGHYGKLPKNWTVCRLNELCSIKGGKRIPHGQTFSKEKTDHAYLRVSDMKNNSIKLSDLKYIDDDVYRQIKRYTIGSDDLYLTVAGTIGCVGIIPKEVDGMNLTENAVKLTNIICDKRFLMYSLLSSEVQNHFSTRFHQVAQPKLSIETASSTLINLPPYEEQKRIVEQIEKQFSSLNIIQSSLEA